MLCEGKSRAGGRRRREKISLKTWQPKFRRNPHSSLRTRRKKQRESYLLLKDSRPFLGGRGLEGESKRGENFLKKKKLIAPVGCRDVRPQKTNPSTCKMLLSRIGFGDGGGNGKEKKVVGHSLLGSRQKPVTFGTVPASPSRGIRKKKTILRSGARREERG